MPDNRVSAALSEADRQAVLAAIETIRQKMPFLIALLPEQRRSLPKMGDRSRAFVGKALNLAPAPYGRSASTALGRQQFLNLPVRTL